MDRETRKANLRKLQLPGTSGKTQRKTRQGAKTSGTSSISNYFPTPEKPSKQPPDKEEEGPLPNNKKPENEQEEPTTKPPKNSRAKRTKLDEFVFRQPDALPADLKTDRTKPVHDDDFDVPEKKAKKAPQRSSKTDATTKTKTAKTTRKKKQTTIKSAFMRNEQLFAEIAAQHCAADNFDGDDVQLAIAISQSEAESRGIVAINDDGEEAAADLKEGGEKNAELIRQKLEKYGFRTAEKEDYNAFTTAFMTKSNGRAKKNSKWANKFTALTLRDEQTQNKKLQQKIDDLLNKQFRIKPLKAEENHLSRFQLQSRLLKGYHKEISKKVLQVPDNGEIPHEEYFVKELFEISNLTPGHLLKNWGAIQGRETPKKRRGPYSEGMSIKLHKIYADLEKHFENIKTSTIAEASNSNVAVEINKETDSGNSNANIAQATDKPIVNDYFNTLRGQESDETIVDSGSSVTSSIYKHIKSVLPPTKSLDLMHVSYSTIKSDVASINSSQSAESNESQKTDTSTAPQEEDLNIKALPNENRNNEYPIIDLAEDVVMVSSGSSTTNSIDKITPKDTITLNSLELMHVSSTSSVRADGITINSLHSVECNTLKNPAKTLITPERSFPNTPCRNNISTKVQGAKPFSCTPVHAEASINSSQKTRSNSPDLFADSDVEMEEEEETANNERGADETNNFSVNKGRNSNDNVGITTYEIYSSDEVKNTLSSEPAEPQTAIKEKLSSSFKCQEQENVVDLTQDDGGEDLWHTAPLNQSKTLVEVDLFADSPINEEAFEFTPDINSNSQTSKYLQQQNNSEETFNLSLSLKPANASNNQTKEATFKFTLSLEMTDMEKEWENEAIFKDFQDQRKQSSFTNLPEGTSVKNLEAKQTQNSPETFYISEESKSQHESENYDNVVFKSVPVQHNEKSSSSLEKAPESVKKLEISFLSDSLEKNKDISLNSPLDVEIAREHDFQVEDDDDVILQEIEINQTNTSFLNFQGHKQLQTCFHRETATEPDVKRKRSVAGNDTIFKELYNKYLGSGAATQQQKTSKPNESILRKSFSQIVPKVVTPTAANTYNDTNFNMDLEITMENFRANRKSLSFNSTSPAKDTIPTNIGLSKSQSFTMHNVSIDLTQIEDDDYAGVAAAAALTEEDNYEDDDCLVLSDDEINYSIWKSNKTGKFKETEINSDSEEDDTKRNSPIPNAKTDQKSITPAKIKNSSQQSYSDFELKSPKKTPGGMEDLLDRSKFGILEEFSETIDFTPNLSTPTKILQEASFLQSPAEQTAQMKRYSIAGSRSAQKFQDLLNGIDNEDVPYNNYDDYDEFDLMIYQNQKTNNTSATSSLPQGFDQLMTAEISFKESQKSFSSSQSSSIEIVEQQQPLTKSINSNAITKTKSLNEIKTTKKIPNFHSSASIITKSSSTTAATKTLSDSDHQQELVVNNKTYKVRSINTPKPNYSLYTEAELLKELYNYGIKPLKRKQAVKMLEYIYLQTHPIIVDDPEEIIEVPEDFVVPLTSKSSVKNNAILSTNSTLVDETTTSDDIAAAGVGNKLNLNDGCGADMLRYSCDLKAELIDEHYILQTNVTKKTQQPLMPFHIAWYNLVCANCKLHESILMYEPIDLQEIYLFLKGLGYRYDPKDLKQFFDRRCIIFRYDLATAGSSNNGNKVKDTNRHVRKKKRTSNKQLTNFVNIS